MKGFPRFFIFFSFFFLPLTGTRLFPASGKEPALAAFPPVIDYGTVLSREVLTKSLVLENRGPGPFLLDRIGYTCGCTVPRILLPSGRIIEPEKTQPPPLLVLEAGKSCRIELVFQAHVLAGRVEHRISFYGPGAEEAALSVPLRAVVRPGFILEPRRLDFGAIRWQGPVTRRMVLRSAGAGDFAVTGLSGLPPFFSARAERVPGAAAPAWRVFVTLKEKPPGRFQNFSLLCELDNPRIHSLRIFGRAEIEPDVLFETSTGGETIDFGVLDRGRGASAWVKIVLTDRSVPYEIESAKILSPQAAFLALRVHTLEAGSSYELFLDVKPGMPVRFFHGRIVVRGTRPGFERKEIPFRGWINAAAGGGGRKEGS